MTEIKYTRSYTGELQEAVNPGGRGTSRPSEIRHIREHAGEDGAVWKIMDVRRWRGGFFEYFAKSGDNYAWILEGTFRPRKKLVVSERDITGAISHLRSLPYAADRPSSWDRKSLLYSIRREVGDRPVIGSCHEVAPFIYGIIGYSGLTLAGEAGLGNESIIVRLAIADTFDMQDSVELP